MDQFEQFDKCYKEVQVKYSEMVTKYDGMVNRNEQMNKQVTKKDNELVKAKDEIERLNEQLLKKDISVTKLKSKLEAYKSKSDDGGLVKLENKISKLKLQLTIKDEKIEEILDLNAQLSELAAAAKEDLETKMDTDGQFMEKIDQLEAELSKCLNTKVEVVSAVNNDITLLDIGKLRPVSNSNTLSTRKHSKFLKMVTVKKLKILQRNCHNDSIAMNVINDFRLKMKQFLCRFAVNKSNRFKTFDNMAQYLVDTFKPLETYFCKSSDSRSKAIACSFRSEICEQMKKHSNFVG